MVLLQLAPIVPALSRLTCLPPTEPVPLLVMSPVLDVRLTVAPDTGALTLIAPAPTVNVPLLALAALVMLLQPGQFCKFTVPAAVSLTLTLPLVACRVIALALATNAVPALPIEPLSLTSTTAAALPVAPLTPAPALAILPLPAVPAVVSRKNVPVLLTVDGLTVTVVPAL